MAKDANSFALFVDDEGDDFQALVARAAAAKIEAAAAPVPEDGKREREPSNGKGRTPLRFDDSSRNEGGRGRGHALRRSSSSETQLEHNGGSENDHWVYVGARRYNQSNEGDSFLNAIDHNTPQRGLSRGRGRGRGLGGRGRGQARGRVFDETFALGNDSEGYAGNNSLENAPQNDGADGGWELVNQYSNRSEGRYQRNGERNWGSYENRGYSNRGYRAREGGSNGRYYGRNPGAGGASVNSELEEDKNNGETHANAINEDNENVDTEGNVQASTEEVKDLELEPAGQGDVVNEENSEIKITKEGNSLNKTKEEILKEIERNKKDEEIKRKKKEDEEESKMMTLEEYEKQCIEKRKALESLKSTERRVALDKDFESMQLVEKKREDSLFAKLKSEKDKLKKKESLEKEEKARKAVSIVEFLKPAEGEDYRRAARGRGRQGPGRWDNGGSRGRGSQQGYRDNGRSGSGFSIKESNNSELHIRDPVHFPGLGAAVKA